MKTNKENVILVKSFDFALQIIELYSKMKEQHEFVLSKQVLRSGTSIGANVEEATAAISKRDFAQNVNIFKRSTRDQILVEAHPA